MSLDLKIKNGTVIDGSGFPRYQADVGVRDGRIVAIGKLSGKAKEEIDADGLIVAPGFIDGHTHYDVQATFEPTLSASCWHGVTTAVMGHCGLSLAPVAEDGKDYLLGVFAKVEQMSLKSLAEGPPWKWSSYGDYLNAIDKGLGVNLVGLVGYNAVRYHVMKDAAKERAATDAETKKLQATIRKAVEEGAFGWSTTMAATHVDPGGDPVPSRIASREEMLSMADAMAGYSVGVISLAPPSLTDGGLSGEDKSFLEAMALRSRRPVVWNGHAFRWDQPDKWREDQEFMEQAAGRGALIYASSRLHTLSRFVNLKRTVFLDNLPGWRIVMQRPVEERVALMKDPAHREAMRRGIDDPDYDDGFKGPKRPAQRWDGFTVSKVALDKNKHLEGMSVVEIARERNVHVADAIADLAVEENLETVFYYSSTVEADEPARGDLIARPHTLPGNSDSGAHVNSYCMAGEPTYFMRYWIGKRGLMSLEEGVRAWTFKPAMAFGLRDRGLVQTGKAADLVIFDEKTIDEGPQEQVQDFPAGETRFISRGVGIMATVVNGEIMTREGKHTGKLPGRVIRSTEYQ